MTITDIYRKSSLFNLRPVLWNGALFITALALCWLVTALHHVIALIAPFPASLALTVAIMGGAACGVRYADAVPARLYTRAYWGLVAALGSLICYALVTGVFTRVLFQG